MLRIELKSLCYRPIADRFNTNEAPPRIEIWNYTATHRELFDWYCSHSIKSPHSEFAEITSIKTINLTNGLNSNPDTSVPYRVEAYTVRFMKTWFTGTPGCSHLVRRQTYPRGTIFKLGLENRKSNPKIALPRWICWLMYFCTIHWYFLD